VESDASHVASRFRAAPARQVLRQRVRQVVVPTEVVSELKDGQRRFGVGHFDLIVIDEAHRSVYQKYRAIFEYFDSLLVGLTATPKDEVAHDTYGLFDLEPGVPTDYYDLDQAVAEGYLVPPRAIDVPLKFPREGIRYDDLSEEEKERWESQDWGDGAEEPPEAVAAEALNRWLFNADTVDKLLEQIGRGGSGDVGSGADRLRRGQVERAARDQPPVHPLRGERSRRVSARKRERRDGAGERRKPIQPRPPPPDGDFYGVVGGIRARHDAQPERPGAAALRGFGAEHSDDAERQPAGGVLTRLGVAGDEPLGPSRVSAGPGGEQERAVELTQGHARHCTGRAATLSGATPAGLGRYRRGALAG